MESIKSKRLNFLIFFLKQHIRVKFDILEHFASEIINWHYLTIFVLIHSPKMDQDYSSKIYLRSILRIKSFVNVCAIVETIYIFKSTFWCFILSDIFRKFGVHSMALTWVPAFGFGSSQWKPKCRRCETS